MTPKQKTKKQKKNTVSKYKFNLEDNLVFIGHAHEKYYGQECTVLERHRKHINYYYKIQFQDESIIDTSETSLKTLEEYEIYLSEIEKKKSININTNDIIYDNHGNYVQCLVPTAFYEMRCDTCGERDKCVYRNKDNYGALKIR